MQVEFSSRYHKAKKQLHRLRTKVWSTFYYYWVNTFEYRYGLGLGMIFDWSNYSFEFRDRTPIELTNWRALSLHNCILTVFVTTQYSPFPTYVARVWCPFQVLSHTGQLRWALSRISVSLLWSIPKRGWRALKASHQHIRLACTCVQQSRWGACHHLCVYLTSIWGTWALAFLKIEYSRTAIEWTHTIVS